MLESKPNQSINHYIAKKETEAYEAIREYQESEDWPYRDFIAEMHRIGDGLRHYFFSPRDEQDPLVPPLLLSARKLRREVVAGYLTVRNELGFRWEITFNTEHVNLDRWNRERWRHSETLLHEMFHLATENLPGYRPCTDNYHHQEFRDLAQEAGLHINEKGQHVAEADGQFAHLMDWWCIPPLPNAKPVPLDAPKISYWDLGKEKKKGTSTLLLFACKCDPPFKIRTGRDNLTALCLACNEKFELQK